MASAECEPIMGVWEWSPQQRPGAESVPGQGVRGQSHPWSWKLPEARTSKGRGKLASCPCFK